MSTRDAPTSHLDASMYSHDAAVAYAEHHNATLRARVTTWREQSLLRRALRRCGALTSVLDIPCGTGRFFPVIETLPGIDRFAADNSDGMLAIAARSDAVHDGRIRLVKTSLFGMQFADASVDCVICLRFLHHIALPSERQHALRELHRVSRRFVVISLWVDGNLQARRRKQPRPQTKGYQRRGWLSHRRVVNEIEESGLRVVRFFDLAPGISMWRFYLLEKVCVPPTR